MSQVIIGMADENLVADLMSLLEEMDGFTVRAVAKSPTELVDLASRLEPDVVFVHETLGIEPVSQTIRDLANRRPSTAVIQVSQIRTPALVIKAMEDGARGVVAYPFAYEDVSTRVIAAAEWSEHMKAVLAGAAVTNTTRGEVVAVVGAKGGVGTTTVAAHLAFDHVRDHPQDKVCLVDVDIEKGDVGAIFEVRQSVSIADVAKVSGDLSPHAVHDAVIRHESGLHLLLAPLDVREGEFVSPEAIRAIVSLLRREFDLVVLDGGGHVSPAQASVVELAGECLVVTTPDVLSVRAMRRRMIAWSALGVREEPGFKVLVNKVDRASLFPANAVAKLTTAHVVETQIPYSPRVLEASINDRDPRAVTEVAWWSLISSLRVELGLAKAPVTASKGRSKRGTSAQTPTAKPKGRQKAERTPRGKALPQPSEDPAATAEAGPAPEPVTAGRSRESGAVGLETVGILPAAVLLCLIGWQTAVTGFSFIYAGHASSVASREYSVTADAGDAERAARAAVPRSLRGGLSVAASGDRVSVTVPVVKGFPAGLPTSLTSTRTVVREQ
ncbi:MAG TPA: P-loop NTPase [Ornithinibacter sp.]|jgi:pilus assembly protein CpaE|nr:P-loop NTPase [Ornithinibacter sp.]HPV89299.1 P-loop NTPase [Ornithinibacter sp.]